MGFTKLDLDGKAAVVIGGSSGIGRTLARGLAEAGADVVPSARRMELVNAVADEIESLGRRSLRVSSDVADRASLETVLQATIQTFGKVDILVNAAGFSQRTPTLDFPEVDWDHLMDTNLTGTLPRVSGFRTSYDRAQLWPHHQHRFDGLIAGPL